jgi:GNAT superfamily N-acetyltransferase
MMTASTVKRTTSSDKDFQILISHLDHELWNELKEDQATYDQYNKVPDLDTVLIAYEGEQAVACRCFKVIAPGTVEIKRMFVEKEWRRIGLSKIILNALEQWALEKGYQHAVLETSIHFTTARRLYESSGYTIIPNYPPYEGLSESVCMHKHLKASPSSGS